MIFGMNTSGVSGGSKTGFFGIDKDGKRRKATDEEVEKKLLQWIKSNHEAGDRYLKLLNSCGDSIWLTELDRLITKKKQKLHKYADKIEGIMELPLCDDKQVAALADALVICTDLLMERMVENEMLMCKIAQLDLKVSLHDLRYRRLDDSCKAQATNKGCDRDKT